MKLSRTQKILAGMACVALYSIPLATINGAFDIFMKTENSTIPKGEYDGSAFPEYQDWIEIDSFSVGGSNPVSFGTGGGTSSGKANLTALTVSMPVGQTSPAMFSFMTSGQHVPEIKLFMRTPNSSTEFMRIYLKTAFVDSINWSGSSGGGDKPFQSISLVYEAIKVEYVSFDSGGKSTGTFDAEWSVVLNKASY